VESRAYVNWGRWVTDCPRWPDCANALALEPGQATARCTAPGGCGLAYTVIWPADAAQITTALDARPAPQTRNWYPAGHDRAAMYGLPCGETPAELDAETAAHAAAAASRHDELLSALGGLGLRLAADGTIEGL
jgi:hypothetical protein